MSARAPTKPPPPGWVRLDGGTLYLLTRDPGGYLPRPGQPRCPTPPGWPRGVPLCCALVRDRVDRVLTFAAAANSHDVATPEAVNTLCRRVPPATLRAALARLAAWRPGQLAALLDVGGWDAVYAVLDPA